MISPTIHGRGAASNPQNRFEQIHVEADPDYDPSEDPSLKTEFFKDTSHTIISYSDSPDLGSMASLNSYRGCEHGCIYCYARPYHEYLSLSAGLDFESKIFVKEKAPQLLAKELMSRKWKPQVIMMSGVTDCYQPAERHFQLTRECLKVLYEFRNPGAIITKNHLVTRDIDILKKMNEFHGCCVTLSVTSLDSKLARVMEPRASTPVNRLDAVKQLSDAGIPVGINIAPVIPALNDQEIPDILKEAVKAGAQYAGLVLVRLPHAVKDLFQDWLTEHFPDRKEKILNRLRDMHGGKLYDASFGKRMTGEGAFARNIEDLFKAGCLKSGLKERFLALSTEHFYNPHRTQLMLFD